MSTLQSEKRSSDPNYLTAHSGIQLFTGPLGRPAAARRRLAFGYRFRRFGICRGLTKTLSHIGQHGIEFGSLQYAMAENMDRTHVCPTNEEWLDKNGYRSDIHHKKPKGRPMSEATSRANGRRSKIRAHIEHPFARLKGPMRLFVRPLGLARARVKIGMANMTYNMRRFVWHEGRSVPA